MAPELIEGEPCYASDQYALGVVAYEWLCGTWPFLGNGDDILEQHLYDFPPGLRQHVPAISEEVEEVVLRALAKNPRERFDSVLQFAVALKAAVRHRTATGRVRTRFPASRPASGNASANMRSRPQAQPSDIWNKILSLFTLDFLFGIAVGTVLYALKVAPSLAWLLLSLSLVLFALVEVLVMRSFALVLLVCGLTIVAGLFAVASQSALIFVMCYLILSGLVLSAVLATSIHIQG
jgi:serine/threonine protein kinase